MKTSARKASKPGPDPQRPFTWGISSTAISFRPANDAAAAIDGSANDCSAISRFDQPRGKKPGKPAGK